MAQTKTNNTQKFFSIGRIDYLFLTIGLLGCGLNLGRIFYLKAMGGSDPFPLSYYDWLLVRICLVLVSTRFSYTILSLTHKAFSHGRYTLFFLNLIFLISATWYFAYGYNLFHNIAHNLGISWYQTTGLLVYKISFYVYNISFILICLILFLPAGQKKKHNEASRPASFSLAHINFTYFAVPILLVGLGAFFIKQHLDRPQMPPTTPPKDKKEWQFTVKPWHYMPYFDCKANTRYSFFISSGTVSKVHLGGGHTVGGNQIGDSFSVEFSKPTKIKLDINAEGLMQKSTITIKEGISEAPLWVFDYLQVNELSPYTIHVKKGQRLDFRQQKEHFYLVYFQNHKEVRRELIKNNYGHYYWFWDSYDLKIMPAEIGFAFIDTVTPHYESLSINGRPYRRALFLSPGEVYETPLYVDNYDEIVLNSRNKRIPPKDFNLIIGGKKHNTDQPPFKSSGILKIKAIQPLVITEIKATHRTQWIFKLNPREERKFHVFAGDVVRSNSDSRYYVDGVIVEAKQNNRHVIHKDRDLIFSGSVIKDKIFVSIEKRRGW